MCCAAATAATAACATSVAAAAALPWPLLTVLVCLDGIVPLLQAVKGGTQPAVALGPIRLQLNTLERQGGETTCVCVCKCVFERRGTAGGRSGGEVTEGKQAVGEYTCAGAVLHCWTLTIHNSATTDSAAAACLSVSCMMLS